MPQKRKGGARKHVRVPLNIQGCPSTFRGARGSTTRRDGINRNMSHTPRSSEMALFLSSKAYPFLQGGGTGIALQDADIMRPLMWTPPALCFTPRLLAIFCGVGLHAFGFRANRNIIHVKMYIAAVVWPCWRLYLRLYIFRRAIFHRRRAPPSEAGEAKLASKEDRFFSA